MEIYNAAIVKFSGEGVSQLIDLNKSAVFQDWPTSEKIEAYVRHVSKDSELKYYLKRKNLVWTISRMDLILSEGMVDSTGLF